MRAKLTLLLILTICTACAKNDEPAQLQNVPSGHTLLLAGVTHAYGANKAPRYCSLCHGEQLEGSAVANRSCYSCHGKKWSDISGTTSFAPSNHTTIHQDFRHDPALNSPEASCSECHGENLQGGGGASLIPGCLTCHIDLWSD